MWEFKAFLSLKLKTVLLTPSARLCSWTKTNKPLTIMTSEVVCSLLRLLWRECVNVTCEFLWTSELSKQKGKKTHHVIWPHLAWLWFIWLWLDTQWWDSTRLQLDRARSHCFITVTGKMFTADRDISPGRFFESLPIDFKQELNPLQSPLRVLR